MKLLDVISPEELEQVMFKPHGWAAIMEQYGACAAELDPYRLMFVNQLHKGLCSPQEAALWLGLLTSIELALRAKRGFADTPVKGPVQ